MVIIGSSVELFPGIVIAGDCQKGHGFVVLCLNNVRLPEFWVFITQKGSMADQDLNERL